MNKHAFLFNIFEEVKSEFRISLLNYWTIQL